MHIGLVTSSLSRQAGGIFDASRFLARYLNKLPDTRVTVFGLADEHTLEDIGGWGDCTVSHFTTKGPKALGYAPGLAPALIQSGVDIVHQHGIWTFVSRDTRRWHLSCLKPYMISVHGMLDSWAVNNSAWKKKLFGAYCENANLRDAAGLHAGSPAEEQAIRDYGQTNPVFIMPNGVEIGAPPQRPFGKPIKQLLYLGRLHPKKGIENLIEAWQRIQPANWTLSIAGEGLPDYERKLKTLINHAPAGISMPGAKYHDEKYRAYENADAFILPSFSEGLPMVILDAFSQGLPVLMTDACNLTDAFREDVAIRIEPEAGSLERSLRTLISMTPEELQRFSASGYSFARDRFSWESIAKQFRSYYETMIIENQK